MAAPRVHPERQRRVKQALTFFSIAAWVTGTWLLLLTARMIAEYLLGMDVPMWMHYIGQIHGLFYMVYLLATLNLGTKALWPPLRWVVTALAGAVPFLSFFVEHWRRSEVKEQFDLN
ncbi:DUF3817 domain-containing protein [Corynebacterium sp. ES2794-CONJ1]|uniref:DUF3817 domain-containing protein n=1 Tax=unclassified Corynebacterium TaxID=2624378 RepID=UPI002166CDFE|nr:MULTISPECIES: DUF3817 domain-containing protein [unclassified Corynebacterium]MCS4490656.1 DUF3817 domain-containing protein [Corynebacterium sp. ES2775-CONJ]MCS4492458.1 DUF3817 domain-containing protein [Corynebacterium sp. ES2715-CONJ3]MCU9519973.1 DUF3817 domain-containing protein [Corynebacterium sp. ES2794-CONJ1]